MPINLHRQEINPFYYIAGSMSGQESESCVLIGYQDRPILPTRDFPLFSAKAKFFGVIFWPYNKSFIGQACSVKMAGYWPRSFFVLLWTSTSSQSIKNAKKKKNFANIQPS